MIAGTMTFRATIHGGHKQDAVEVPFDPADQWGLPAQPLRPGRRGLRVHATLHGEVFATAIVRRSNRFWLLLPEAVERAAGVTAGDLVELGVAPDRS